MARVAPFREACAGVRAEWIVAGAADRAERMPGRGCEEAVRFVAVGAGATVLVPKLWAAGLETARGEVVAFTTEDFRPARGWGSALLAALRTGATGASGPIHLGENTGIREWAVYLQRYSAFMPPMPDGAAREIPGDNAAYPRRALLEAPGVLEEGVWDVEFHRLVRERGGRLVFVEEAATYLERTPSLSIVLRHRFLHAARFGRYRTANGESRLRCVLAGPMVPFVLVGRILRRAGRRKGLRWRAVLALPLVAVLSCVWAAGEAWGSLVTRRGASGRRRAVLP